MGMFQVTSATEYRYVTGHRRTGMFNDNRPYITLRYRDGQGRDAEQHCGKV